MGVVNAFCDTLDAFVNTVMVTERPCNTGDHNSLQFCHSINTLSILMAISMLTWVSRCLLKQRMMEVVVTTGYKSYKAPVKSSPPINQHPVFLQAGCPSCCPTNSCQRTEGKYNHYTIDVHFFFLTSHFPIHISHCSFISVHFLFLEHICLI